MNLQDRCFHQSEVDRAWGADITYESTGEGWLYLASRRIVGWIEEFYMGTTKPPAGSAHQAAAASQS